MLCLPVGGEAAAYKQGVRVVWVGKEAAEAHVEAVGLEKVCFKGLPGIINELVDYRFVRPYVAAHGVDHEVFCAGYSYGGPEEWCRQVWKRPIALDSIRGNGVAMTLLGPFAIGKASDQEELALVADSSCCMHVRVQDMHSVDHSAGGLKALDKKEVVLIVIRWFTI